MGKVALIIAPDRADRIRALVKCADLASAGSDHHWRRLARLDQGTKAAVWAALNEDVKGKLKALKASLEYRKGAL